MFYVPANKRKNIKLLLNNNKVNIDINVVDAKGNTCIFYYPAWDNILRLLKAGLNAGIVNEDGENILFSDFS